MGTKLVGRRLLGIVRHLGQGTALRSNIVGAVTVESLRIGQHCMTEVSPKMCWRFLRNCTRIAVYSWG